MLNDTETVLPRRPAYFWWLLANALALCFAVLSWTLCLHIFGNPEIPRNYRILQAIGRAPEFKAFTVAKAPAGGVMSPKEFYRQFIARPKDQLDLLNSRLLRNYLTRFSDTQLLTYVEGDFTVKSVRKLGENDFFSKGIVLRAVAMMPPDEFSPLAEYPVVVELLLPMADDQSLPALGSLISFTRKPQFAAVLHVAKIAATDEPGICVTAMPIVGGSVLLADGIVVRLGEPGPVNLSARLPIF